jgi:hypothetical protein
VTVSAPLAPRRPPRLVLRFASYSALALALAWLAIFLVIRHTESTQAREAAQERALRIAQRTVPALQPSDFTGPVTPERRAELGRLYEKELLGDLLRVKLWGPAGTVTYSDDQSVIGSQTTPGGRRRAGP